MILLKVASVTAQLTIEVPNQLVHVTSVDRDIYIQLMVSCLLRGIIWQSDKQTDRQTDKQSVGYWQRSHCQSHCHSVPLSSPTATGQYLSRQSPSLPNIEQHAIAVFFSPKWFLDSMSLFSLCSSCGAILGEHGWLEMVSDFSFSLSFYPYVCLFFCFFLFRLK